MNSNVSIEFSNLINTTKFEFIDNKPDAGQKALKKKEIQKRGHINCVKSLPYKKHNYMDWMEIVNTRNIPCGDNFIISNKVFINFIDISEDKDSQMQDETLSERVSHKLPFYSDLFYEHEGYTQHTNKTTKKTISLTLTKNYPWLIDHSDFLVIDWEWNKWSHIHFNSFIGDTKPSHFTFV